MEPELNPQEEEMANLIARKAEAISPRPEFVKSLVKELNQTGESSLRWSFPVFDWRTLAPMTALAVIIFVVVANPASPDALPVSDDASLDMMNSQMAEPGVDSSFETMRMKAAPTEEINIMMIEPIVEEQATTTDSSTTTESN